MAGGTIVSPTQRKQSASGHVCEFKVAKVDDKGEPVKDSAGNVEMIELTEAVCRELQIEEGSLFVCRDTVKRDGKDAECGKEYRLHYPSGFQWKQVRARVTKDDANGTEPGQEPALEPAQTGKRKQ